MNLTELINQLKALGTSFQKTTTRLISLLEELKDKNLKEEEKETIRTSILPYLQGIQSEQEVKTGLKKLRKSLRNDFGFVYPSYYMALGIGIGLGTALGTSFGIPFEKGVVFGPMIGSGIGLAGGLLVGRYLDKRKEAENRVLKYL